MDIAIFRMWGRLWSERRNKLWVLPALNSIVAIVLALLAAWIPDLLPQMRLPKVDADTLNDLLGVIASSMLAVTTFSLSIMVAAFASASSGVTPRATELVMGDEGTRAAIANFLSAFMFSIVAKVALGMKYYGENGRFILFVATCVVLVWLMLTLLRWVRTLSSLGRLGNTLSRVEDATLHSMQAYWEHPFLQAKPLPDGLLQASQSMHHVLVRYDDVKFVRRIDMEGLQKLAEKHDCFFHLLIRPGMLVSVNDVLAVIQSDSQSAPMPKEEADTLAKTVTQHIYLDSERTFDQDPRFGMVVLREAAQRALSAAINDPGTAITCLNSMTRILLKTQIRAELAEDSDTVVFDRLSVIALNVDDFLNDGFDPVARDGAASFEIMVKMQKLLYELVVNSANKELAACAVKHAEFAYQCAKQSLPIEQDREVLHKLYLEMQAVQAGKS